MRSSLTLSVIATAVAGSRSRDITTEINKPADLVLPDIDAIETPGHLASHKPHKPTDITYSSPNSVDLGFGDEDIARAYTPSGSGESSFRATSGSSSSSTSTSSSTTTSASSGRYSEESSSASTHFGKAVDAFNLDSIFIDEECYQQQIDIYSDQLVAIEALRRTVVGYTERLDICEEELVLNGGDEINNRNDDISNKDRVYNNKYDIEIIEIDTADVEACYDRQVKEETYNRHTLELYCHQHAYVTWILDECQPILVDRTQLPYGWETWTLNDHVTPGVSEGGRGKVTDFEHDHEHEEQDDHHSQTQNRQHQHHNSSAAAPQGGDEAEVEAETDGNASIVEEVSDNRPPGPTVEFAQETDAEEPAEPVADSTTESETTTSEYQNTEVQGSTEDETEVEVVEQQQNYAISDAKLKKVKDYCKQLCDFGFDPDELCVEFHFTCDNTN